MGKKNKSGKSCKVEIRTALILLLGALTGLGAGTLALVGGLVWPFAVIVGCGAAAGAVRYFDRLIK